MDDSIIIRNKIFPCTSISPRVKRLIAHRENKIKMAEALDCDGIDGDLLNSELYKNFVSFKNQEKKTGENFIRCYKIAPDFAVHIDANIYLYHISQEQEYLNFVPWLYADGKKYIGDPWWETDEEILENIKKMNIVDFLRAYKGY